MQKTFIDGTLYFDRDADRERQARIDEIKDRLLGRDDEPEGAAPTDTPSAPETPATETTPQNPNHLEDVR